MRDLLPAAGTRDAVDLCVSNCSDQREPTPTPVAEFQVAWDGLSVHLFIAKQGGVIYA